MILEKKKIKAAVVSLGKTKTVNDLIELEWNVQSLGEAVKKIREKFEPSAARVVLGDDLSYSLELMIPKGVENERIFIGMKISGKIPEVLEDKDWDFKEIGQTKDYKKIKVFAPTKSVWKDFLLAAKENNLEIEAVESISSALEGNSDPLIGMAMKDDILGKDEKVLNIKPVLVEVKNIANKEDLSAGQNQGIKTDEVAVENVMEAKEKSRNDAPQAGKSGFRKIILIFIAVLLAVGLTTGGIFTYERFLEETPSSTPESDSIIPTIIIAEPTPTEVLSVAELKIQVLNGSGVAGKANKAKEYLEGLGYENIEIGNAGSFDYRKTVLSIKSGREIYKNRLIADLSSEYSLSEKIKTIDGLGSFDVTIVVGRD